MEGVASWLARQCRMLPGAMRAVAVLGRPDAPAAACWPEGSGPHPDLEAAAMAALVRRSVLAEDLAPRPGLPPTRSRVAVPFPPAAGVLGAVALELADVKSSEAAPVVAALRSGAAWLPLARQSEPGRERYATTLLAWLSVALEAESRDAAALRVATELAATLGCERVAIGALEHGRMRLLALSHSARFDPRTEPMRVLVALLEEAADQDATVAVPAPAGAPAPIAREHERAQQAQGGALWSVPLPAGGRVVGAIHFEARGAHALDPGLLRLCEEAAAHLGPALELAQRAGAPLRARARERLRDALRELAGPRRTGTKLALAGALCAALLLGFASGPFRVTADATLEGRVQRAVVAGLEGYVAEAHARAGDLVRQGEVLGRLDDRDLELERRKWTGRHAALRKEYREALASHDRARVAVLTARLAEAEAELDLLEARLARTALVAPFDGVVVRGDLSQALGSPVEKGEVLFEVAPLDGYRIVLRVDERDVAHVAPGQPGSLALSALPGQTLPLTVERVIPVASVHEGRNVFPVEARVEQGTSGLRPGMAGVAKIEAGHERLSWIWTRRAFDALRLWAWGWWP
jgi:RND family efflux transporter MFP subunit